MEDLKEEVDPSNDPVLDLAVEYALNGRYPDNLSNTKKRAVRKRSEKLLWKREK